MKHTLITLALTLTTTASFAATRDDLVISATALQKSLNDPKLVLLHVGEKGAYAKEHIPGARLIGQQDVSVSHHSGAGLMLEMPPAEELRKRLQSFGISDDSRIVIYYGKDWVSPSTRIIFTLDHAGLGGRTQLLDGGLDAWKRAGGKVTDVVPAARRGTLSALAVKPIVVDAKFVAANIAKAGFAVVDGRAPMFYDGIEQGDSHGVAHRKGHVAGALNIPFTEITSDDLTLRPASELAALFAQAGVKSGDTVIGYCHIGQQTTAMLFAARSLGHRVLLYDGSFEDWSARKELPVSTQGATRSAR